MLRPTLCILSGLSVGGLPVQLRRSERRTVGLKVTAAGLTIYAPRRIAEAHLRSLVEDKRAWAEQHLRAFLVRQELNASPLIDGCVLPYAGEELTLRALPGLKRAVRVGNELHAPENNLSVAVEAWYRSEAQRIFPAIAEEFAARLSRSLPLTGVRLTNAGARWGSCTAAGVVRLHWRLLLTPPEVMRYVAAHEVAHLIELNHSPRYWAEVERLFPAYLEAERWLKLHGAAVMRGWGNG
ncbi:M48 family metallopeptidase [Deinococcus sp.]|uniref:M48 family metallopeptidase n=1 Tax=Deinococcus sp. TaxID=47478 RepID=UPI003B592CDB